MRYRRNFETVTNPFNAIASVLVMVLLVLGLFYLAQFILKLLWWVAPIVFIASLIIDHRVFLNYAHWVGGLLRNRTLMGVAILILSLVGFPFLALYFLGKALFRRKVRQAQEESRVRREGELIDYEELDSEPLDLPSPRLRERPEEMRPRQDENRRRTDYDNLFDE